MANVSQFSTSASSNNQASPDGAPENWAPSDVNNWGRELMAALARWYQDTNGTLVTTGTGNAYALSTNNNHSALADISLLVFRADRANTGAATLAVDGLASKDLVRADGAALIADDIKANGLLLVAYNANQDKYFILSLTGLSDASETIKGVAEIATQAETDTGTDDARIVTPKKLTDWSGHPSTASESDEGIAEIATQAETDAESSDVLIVSPKKLGSWKGMTSRLLASATAAASASVDFTSDIDSTYESYLFLGSRISAATGGGVNLLFQTSSDGGGSYDSSGYVSAIEGINASGSSVSAGTDPASAVILKNGVAASADQHTSFALYFNAPATAGVFPTVHGTVVGYDESGALSIASIGGAREDNASAVNAVRFAMTTGNIATGEFALYGLRFS